MNNTKIVSSVCKLGKILIVSVIALGFVSQVQAAGMWFKGVTVSRVITGVDLLQIGGDNGCSSQSASSYYITTQYTTDTDLLSRYMNLVSVAQASGKTISFYTDCDLGTIEQLCLNEPALDITSC